MVDVWRPMQSWMMVLKGQCFYLWQHLGLKGTAKSLVLRTIRQKTEVLRGGSVNFTISAARSQRKYQVKVIWSS